jgi:hypothetical protein
VFEILVGSLMDSCSTKQNPLSKTEEIGLMTCINFWLNEIKSKDDSIRLLINIHIVLTGTYCVIIAANIDKIKIFTPDGILGSMGLIYILSIPIHIWFSTILILLRGQAWLPQNSEQLLCAETSITYLVKLCSIKSLVLTYSFFGIFAPFTYFLIIFSIYMINIVFDFPLLSVLFALSILVSLINYIYFLKIYAEINKEMKSL